MLIRILTKGCYFKFNKINLILSFKYSADMIESRNIGGFRTQFSKSNQVLGLAPKHKYFLFFNLKIGRNLS